MSTIYGHMMELMHREYKTIDDILATIPHKDKVCKIDTRRDNTCIYMELYNDELKILINAHQDNDRCKVMSAEICKR